LLKLFLIGWTALGLAIAIKLLWSYFGEEKFTIINDMVIFEKSIFGIGSKRELMVRDIKNVRTIADESDGIVEFSTSFVAPIQAGKIIFTYGEETIAFGLALSDSEAKHIAAIVREYLRH
jgi:hypothetical protein